MPGYTGARFARNLRANSCYIACGHSASTKARLIRHLQTVHNDEVKKRGSAAHAIAIACGQTFCGDCGSMGRANKDGSITKKHTCKAKAEPGEEAKDTGEALDAPKTPKLRARTKRPFSGERASPSASCPSASSARCSSTWTPSAARP